jgi:uncharacterized membrane protein YeaQ/YmgE (transglycosylase-associated protein family)
MSIIYFIIIGGVAGWLAGRIMRGRAFGIFWNIILGIAGGVIGGWAFGLLGLASDGSMIGSLVTALVGAIIVLAIARSLR